MRTLRWRQSTTVDSETRGVGEGDSQSWDRLWQEEVEEENVWGRKQEDEEQEEEEGGEATVLSAQGNVLDGRRLALWRAVLPYPIAGPRSPEEAFRWVMQPKGRYAGC